MLYSSLGRFMGKYTMIRGHSCPEVEVEKTCDDQAFAKLLTASYLIWLRWLVRQNYHERTWEAAILTVLQGPK